MQRRHHDRWTYFQEQERITREHVIPFVARHVSLGSESRVLEIGCGEGGNLVPFVDLGYHCTGVDVDAEKIENGNAFFARRGLGRSPELHCADIYDLTGSDLGGFDLVVLRDVIEHIHHQERFLRHLAQFLRPGGRAFFGFPPWQMPFGGHQQGCTNRILSLLPYYHLLPDHLYRSVLRLGGESEATIQTLMEVKQTGISIEEMRAALAAAGYHIDEEALYLINPGYEVKFGLKPRAQSAIVAAIPYLRNFVTTCDYTIASL